MDRGSATGGDGGTRPPNFESAGDNPPHFQENSGPNPLSFRFLVWVTFSRKSWLRCRLVPVPPIFIGVAEPLVMDQITGWQVSWNSNNIHLCSKIAHEMKGCRDEWNEGCTISSILTKVVLTPFDLIVITMCTGLLNGNDMENLDSGSSPSMICLSTVPCEGGFCYNDWKWPSLSI